MTELEALVWLNSSGMVGSALLRRLREGFDLTRLDRVPARDLERVPGVGPVTARAIRDSPPPQSEIELARRERVDLLACTDPEYPPALRGLYDHPLVIYRRGRPSEADALAIGIVGSRSCTEYGRRQARRFAEGLGRLGVTVVSGLARGIDTAAHRGALAAKGGRTFAVLGSGLLRVYPPENARLLEEICARGAALSEFPLTARPEPTRFPRRNRLISGLSQGTLVVEAAERSGALITADWALEQNRDVFCLPGPVESPMSRGCHRLIRQGARLVEGPADLLEEIPAFAGLLEPSTSLTPLERAALRALGPRPLSTEAVAAATRLPHAATVRALTSLVAKGAARAESASEFARADVLFS